MISKRERDYPNNVSIPIGDVTLSVYVSVHLSLVRVNLRSKKVMVCKQTFMVAFLFNNNLFLSIFKLNTFVHPSKAASN